MSCDIRSLRPVPQIQGRGVPPSESVPQVGTDLSWSDRLGAWKVRWGLGRGNYRVKPGLYRLGEAGPASPILVTANYKLTFDTLRGNLRGIAAWILVLDTAGVNVWCAAGKGAFGTDELVRRIEATGLSGRVSHRSLIVPQLGAVGVDASAVEAASSFRVLWGPVRATDLGAYLSAGNRASPRMRRVEFRLRDRVVLAPVELVQAAKSALPALGIVLIASLFGLLRFERIDFLGLLGAWLVGAAAVPALLPWVPGRAFSAKGAILGALWGGLWIIANGGVGPRGIDLPRAVAWATLLPSVSAFLGMNFTGSSTYTSFSGVVAEMRVALPLIVAGTAVGVLGLAAGAVLGA